MKYIVTEIVHYVYEVEASSETDAKNQVLASRGSADDVEYTGDYFVSEATK